ILILDFMILLHYSVEMDTDTNPFLSVSSVALHSHFRRNRDSKELSVPSDPALILNAVHHAVFVLTGVQALLSWSLVWTNTDFFILLGAGVPQVKLICDITADGRAFRV